MTLDHITIVLPWPDSSLMPNRKNGRHWGNTQSAKVRARQDGYLAAVQARGAHTFIGPERIRAKWTFVAPDRRRRDLDGLYGACKHYQDGIAQALGIDDSVFRPVVLDDCLDRDKRGFIVVEIGGQS